jgi:hypothetical protein
MVLRHILARAVRDVLSYSYHHNAWPPRSPDLNPLNFCLWGHVKPLYIQLLFTTNGHIALWMSCQSIRNYPGIFKRMRRSLMRRIEACIEFHGGHFENLF